MARFYKAVFIFLGTLSLCIGVIGIFIPGLPTTPFLLLTAALYLRGSNKLYNSLITNPYVGGYIIRYRNQRGMTLKQKIIAMSLMWIMVFISVILFINMLYVKAIIIAVGVIGSVVMGFVVPTVADKNAYKSN